MRQEDVTNAEIRDTLRRILRFAKQDAATLNIDELENRDKAQELRVKLLIDGLHEIAFGERFIDECVEIAVETLENDSLGDWRTP